MGKRKKPQDDITHKIPGSPKPGVILGKSSLKTSGQPSRAAGGRAKEWALLIVFWSYVLIPLAWGVSATVYKAALLFR